MIRLVVSILLLLFFAAADFRAQRNNRQDSGIVSYALNPTPRHELRPA